MSCTSIKQPVVQYTDYVIKSVDIEKTNLNFNFTINNPNVIGLDEALYDYQILINGKEVLAEQNIKFKMPANLTTNITLPVTIKYISIFNTASALIEAITRGDTTMPYEIKASFRLNFIAFPFTIPFSEKGTLPLPKLTDIKANNLSLDNFFK